MNDSFIEQYLCTWVVSDRELALRNALMDYYGKTNGEVSPRYAISCWQSLKSWVHLNGYSLDEFNRAKRQCLKYVD